jgi:hypothetical protein
VAAGRHLYRRLGLSGDCFQRSEVQDEAILGLGLDALRDPLIRNEALQVAQSWALSNSGYLAGRFSAGAVTSYASGTGIRWRA